MCVCFTFVSRLILWILKNLRFDDFCEVRGRSIGVCFQFLWLPGLKVATSSFFPCFSKMPRKGNIFSLPLTLSVPFRLHITSVVKPFAIFLQDVMYVIPLNSMNSCFLKHAEQSSQHQRFCSLKVSSRKFLERPTSTSANVLARKELRFQTSDKPGST